MKDGIAVVGTILVDNINEISAYPKCGELTKINRAEKSVGGCVMNVAIDLKKIDPNLTVKAVGKIGADDDGEYIKSVLVKNGVDIDGVIEGETKTSFTEVMSVLGGQRTFFTYAGANAEFKNDDVNLEELNVKMLHLGYFLLMEKIDGGDGEKLLKRAKENNVITSIDLVTENSDRYSVVLPCLPYVDNLIINESEAGKIVGIEPTSENLFEIAKKLKSLGVQDRVIVHTPKLSICLSDRGQESVASYELDDNFILGTTGAGDAFCAGALYSIYKNRTDRAILECASATAVAALSKADSTSGLRSEEEIIELCKNFKRKAL
ncbi:MAG: carbohydrate kinase family protein [Clostridia bacterium]|nr:carbohydrate kinase family protein [Clostridia bacterium]